MKITRAVGAALFASLAASGGAQALVVDFTDSSLFTFNGTSSSASVTIAGVTTTVSGLSGGSAAFLNSDTVSAAGAAECTTGASGGPALSCGNDGAGIGDDEIGLDEILNVTFSQFVEVTGIYLFDMFTDRAATPPDEDIADIDFNNGFDVNVGSNESLNDGGNGYRALTGLSETTNSLAFTAADQDGSFGDFSLAALEFNLVDQPPELEVIPLPATWPLLLGGFAAMALVRRRRAAPAPAA